MNNNGCLLCGTEAEKRIDVGSAAVYYDCPVCGRYELQMPLDALDVDFDYNHLSFYLFYNKFSDSIFDPRYYTNRDKEWCDKWNKEMQNKEMSSRPVHISREIVENWFPKTFSEKIDSIVLYLNKRIKHIGEKVSIKKEELNSLLFIDRYDYSSLERKNREANNVSAQRRYMLEYLKQNSLIAIDESEKFFETNGQLRISIMPNGYERVDILQKNISNGHEAFIAMAFGEKTNSVREAIRKGVKNAGYNPIFIDEVQHNDFITPEILKHIKNSKFVVVDLTNKNNGAYFEEGYAMGLGKDVIQLCKARVRLHFDIAQKNTIIWKDEDEITEKLTNRIKATID